MKTITIYQFNELAESSKDTAILRSGHLNLISKPDTKEIFIKRNLEKEVNLTIPKIISNLLCSIEYDTVNYRQVRTTQTPEFIPKILFIDGKVFLKLHCKYRFCVSSLMSQYEKRTGISQAKGGKFKFDEKQESFHLIINGKSFNIMDEVELCLLPEQVLKEVNYVKEHILRMELELERYLNEWITNLDYDTYLNTFNATRNANIQEYFEDKWFFYDGSSVPDILLLEILELDNG